MTRFAHFHHLFLLCLFPVAILIACVPLLAHLAARFEAWVERTDFATADRSMTGAAALALFSAATVLVLAVLAGITTGAFARMVR